jgi:hypothetical protein
MEPTDVQGALASSFRICSFQVAAKIERSTHASGLYSHDGQGRDVLLLSANRVITNNDVHVLHFQ